MTAVKPDAPPSERAGRARVGARWFMVVGPPLAAFAQQQVAYSFVDAACQWRAIVAEHLPAIVALLIVGFAFFLARREWERGGRREPGDDELPIGTPRFFAVLGFLMSAISLIVIVAQWLPIVFLEPCLR
ncbi:MAG: hypothetical protein ACJ79A_06370 [Gemmatimonadaceae bacterium]